MGFGLEFLLGHGMLLGQDFRVFLKLAHLEQQGVFATINIILHLLQSFIFFG